MSASLSIYHFPCCILNGDRTHERRTSKESSKRHSSILRRISLMRQSPEQDELHLLEEAEPNDLDFVTEENVQLRKERRRRSTATEMEKKRISSSDVSEFSLWYAKTTQWRNYQVEMAFVYSYFHLHSLFL